MTETKVQKIIKFQPFQGYCCCLVNYGFQPNFAPHFSSLELLLLLVVATDPLVLLGLQPNDINFPFNWFKGELTRRGKCKSRSPIGLKRESS
ncbi:hypothetical protein H5410_007351 [Solanum commersonii]|uniref:Uncharacterized protein n=1 Tax=Solanum commersonii TaxID=4109 RepID=A0A9J6ABV8_SOLCO|nr:hypothetical protein H5410_007351 [Solanum commersonii]